MITGHGNNLYQYRDGVIKIDFSSNIAFNNRSSQIIEYLKDQLSTIKNYPDPIGVVLRDKIASHHNIESNKIMIVNGSAEAFYLVAHFLSNQYNQCQSTILTPSFAEYEDSCKLYKHNISYKEIESYDSLNFSCIDSLWFGTPNNPNGYRIGSEDIISLAKREFNTFFVVDKAYNELSLGVEFEKELPSNLILINSLTKSFGIPGLRIGYIISSPEIIQKLIEMRPPWSVNSIALSAGEYIMDNYSELSLKRDELISESQFLQQEISKLDQFKVVKSPCNFFLCEINTNRDIDELKNYLIENYGILIRDASNFRTLTRQHFRVAAQTREKNIELIEALKSWK